MLLVRDFLERSAGARPDAIALVCGERRWSYREIDWRSNGLARALRERGIGRGDRVVLWCPNAAELVIALFAVTKAGAVFVVVHDAAKPRQVEYVIADSGARGLFATGAHVRALADFLTASRTATVVVRDDEASSAPLFADDAGRPIGGDAEVPPPRVGIDRDLACLIYTSGSTGSPKGVMSAHHHVAFASASILEYLPLTPADVVFCALPLAFDYGLYQLLMAFRSGASLVLERSFGFAADCLTRLAATRVTVLPVVPTMVALLVQHDLSRYDLGALRLVTNTAAVLPPVHIAALRRALPDVEIVSMYGLTETKRCLYLPPDLLDAHRASVGVAIPGTEVWLEDEHGNRLPDGAVGELVVRGGHVMAGYWNDAAATAARFRAGPLPGERVCMTGDLFRRDEHGLYYFVGRRDDILKCRGEKVAPREVETVLHALPGVLEAAVVGVPDAVLGQAIVAVVVRRNDELTAADVLRHCRASLEDFKVPQRVEFVASLPKSPNGKVRRGDLAASLA